MHVSMAIAQADALRPNALDEARKAGWLAELDGKLAETLGVDPLPNIWPKDWELLMPHPCDNIYELYLCAMIDQANQETALYANDMAVFNTAYGEATAWWRRRNTPPYRGGWKL